VVEGGAQAAWEVMPMSIVIRVQHGLQPLLRSGCIHLGSRSHPSTKGWKIARNTNSVSRNDLGAFWAHFPP
jgi:hypothetical protein